MNSELKRDLQWLEENWRRKELATLSPYNAAFFSSLQNVLADSGTPQDVERIVEGTLGKVADGYAHLLDVDPADLATDPWAALRRLGRIAERMKGEW